MDWLPENRDELRAALRCKAAVHRAARQGVKAIQIEAEAANPVELLKTQTALPQREQIGGQKLFGAPALPPLGHGEIGSVQYMAERLARRPPRFANERAARVLEAQKEE
jgi:hypothetical protein